MSNFLEHHHELRIPATETLADLTKIIFHSKEEAHPHCDLVHGPLPDHDSMHHKKSLATAKRHAHPGPKHGVIETYDIAGAANSSGLLIERIRCTFSREVRHLDENQMHSDVDQNRKQPELSADETLESVYESLIAESKQLPPERIEPDHLLDNLVALAQEATYGPGVEM